MIARFLLLLLLALAIPLGKSEVTRKDAISALNRGISYFHSISVEGGYVHFVTPDLSRRWGEGEVDHRAIEVQPPGTPAVGLCFLRAYQTTQSEVALSAAKDAAFALIKGQNRLGGWQHTIQFDRPKKNEVSFDDDQMQTALSFLMALDQEVDDPSINAAVNKALTLMIDSQLSNGGWPHKFPEQGNYHDYATFNDEGINDCIRVMIEADRYYDRADLKSALYRAGRFIMISQIAPPQPGWAQQYNEFLQPAWARTFEPPSVCPSVTVNNINTLLDLHLYLGKSEYLEPIPDSIRWLWSIRLENGKWARFVELFTNQPLYYDRGRKRVDTLEELSEERRTGYGYETELESKLNQAIQRFETVQRQGRKFVLDSLESDLTPKQKSKRIATLAPRVETILKNQDEKGRWITKNDRFKKRPPGSLWKGDYESMDRISSQVFIQNIDTLCEYIKLIDSNP